MNKILLVATILLLAACSEKPPAVQNSASSPVSQKAQQPSKNEPQIRFETIPMPPPDTFKNPKF